MAMGKLSQMGSGCRKTQIFNHATLDSGQLFCTETITPGNETMQQKLLDKHYLRKNAYYGQG